MHTFLTFQLQDEAALTLQCIEKCKDGGFEEIFMTKVDSAAKYDYCIRLDLKGKSEVHASGYCLDDECWRLYEQKVQSLLNQGLNNRANLIRVTWRNALSECSIENGFSILDREPLLVGVSVSSMENAFRVVDIGPNVENKEELFGFGGRRLSLGDLKMVQLQKAQVRYSFMLLLAAGNQVWESERWNRHLILKRISEYVLLRHLSSSKENIVHIVDQLDFSLLHGVRDPISFSGSLLEALEVLSKRLHLIQDIPLKLEGSRNWPVDDIAIEKTKTAFLLKIGESLQNSWGMTCTATEDDVDVFVSGYVYRLKIWHERGLSLLKREDGSESSDQFKWVCSIDKELFVHSQHSSMINALQGRYQLYGPVVRIAKRWVASHLFSSCLVEEAVELLVAHLFLKPLPFNAPCSRITGFLRFLRLLSEYDWTFSALVVDINEDLSTKDEKEISNNFMLTRKGYEENKQNVSAAMFLATAYDKASEAWTRFSPNVSELKRLVAYARSSANLLNKLILQDQIDSYKWECLLRTPLNNYDAVILLHRDNLPYPQRLLFPSELNQGKHVARGNASKVFQPFMSPGDFKGSSEELKNKLLVNFDPLRFFVGDLEKEFSNMFKVWYDSLGGDAIGITWDRFSSKKRGREEGEDPVDVLKSVGQFGKGFVRSVYSLKSPRLMN
ncbi:nucleolar protein 6 [Quercus suber]|uniref:Nucleolar protein 6 n=1 Tax=Quercus suber TaxID=58331 RepID=A0AAW0M9F2_QUESU